MRLNLSDLAIKNLKPPARGQRTYLDATLPGFGLRVSQGGTKTFTLMHGEDRRLITIGRYPILTLAKARQRAKELLAEQTLGIAQTVPTLRFDEAFALFKQTHTSQKNRERTAKETERLIEKHLIPKLGRRGVSDITTHDVMQLVDKLLPTPGTAIHVFWAARLMFRWAEKRRLISRSPLDGVDAPGTIEARERTLTDDELATVLRTAATTGLSIGRIVQLLILTGQRRGEIAALRWSWIDEEARTITIPGDFVKNGRTHIVPFGEMTAAVLASVPKTGELLFPARGHTDRAFNGWSKSGLAFNRSCGIEHFQLHDLRRSAASGLQRCGVRLETIEKLLNHISGSFAGIVSVYQRHDFLPEMRDAIERWEAHLDQLVSHSEPRLHEPQRVSRATLAPSG
jgi:integrase